MAPLACRTLRAGGLVEPLCCRQFLQGRLRWPSPHFCTGSPMIDSPIDAAISEFIRLPIALEDLAPPADAVIVVPPFAQLDFPHLGAHLLQSGARAAGFQVTVLYAGMFLARE